MKQTEKSLITNFSCVDLVFQELYNVAKFIFNILNVALEEEIKTRNVKNEDIFPGGRKFEG